MGVIGNKSLPYSRFLRNFSNVNHAIQTHHTDHLLFLSSDERVDGALGGLTMNLLRTGYEFSGFRPKILGMALGMFPGLVCGIAAVLSQKYDVYPAYDS
eukprot:sb/3478671/